MVLSFKLNTKASDLDLTGSLITPKFAKNKDGHYGVMSPAFRFSISSRSQEILAQATKTYTLV